MPEYQCLKCTARVEAKDLAEAILTMDHAIGISKGRPCAGGDNAPIHEIDTPREPTKVIVQTETPKKQETKKPKSDE